MKRSSSPYGEARRLRYFVLICKKLLQSPSVDINFFIDRLLKSLKMTNPELSEYVRNTGIIQSRAVARNYLSFANWLDFLKIDGRLVVPNSHTVFLANLEGNVKFVLSKKEKVAFFLNLVKLDDLVDLLSRMKIKNSIRDYVLLLNLSEHFIESYFEWFVDLGLLKPTRSRFGQFKLSNLGYHVGQSCRNKQTLEISGTYITQLLDTPIGYNLTISDQDIWDSFEKSLKRLAQHTQSEIDSNLYSVFPLLLDLQIELIFDYHLLIPIKTLIRELQNISTSFDAIFSWDALTNAGYIKIR